MLTLLRPGCVAVVLCGLGGIFPAAVCAQSEVEKLRTRVTQLEEEVAALRSRLARLETPGRTEPAPKLKITVLPGDWNSSTSDVEAVCRSAAAELTRSMPNCNTDPITVRRDTKNGPMVVYGKGDDGERRVLINSGNRLWSQVAFQFAHEVCHIQCNYRVKEKSNLWFEESLCEAASLFALRGMAKTWETKPPYDNWKSYSTALRDYAAQRIAATEKLNGISPAEWYRQNEAALRSSGVDRAKNQIVAVALLPLLEKNPEHWGAVRYLNQDDPNEVLSFPQFLRNWYRRVPEPERDFVEAVAALFELSVK